MSLKRSKSQLMEGFSMASMTDVIFLLLIFFLVSSTIIVPNVIKVSLPSSVTQPQLPQAEARISIDSEGAFYLAFDRELPVALTPQEIALQLGAWAVEHPEGFVAIHADEAVPYSEVVKMITATSKAGLKVVLATRVANE